MYLKKVKIQNFRNFRTTNNEVEFVNSIKTQKDEEDAREDVDIESIETEQSELEGEEIAKVTPKINVASVTTLIVGKNNAGKTTIIAALDKLINKNGNQKFNSCDFNFSYLNECINSYINHNCVEVPFLEFIITIALDEGSDDRLNNLVPFMLLEDVKDSELEICIRYEVEEEDVFKTQAKVVLDTYKTGDSHVLFRKYLNFVDSSTFKLNFYDKTGRRVEDKFKLSNLIDLEVIRSNLIKKDSGLTDAFNKIVTYRYEHILGDKKDEIEKEFDKVNKGLTKKIKNHHTDEINHALGNIVSENHIKVDLSADITLDKMLDRLIKYEFVEKDFNIPENQFGSGYINLMMIIAALLDYIERYPDTKYNSKINLVAIEEPETYMHPQMQELFINNINEVITQLIGSKNKNINSQLIITTHSSHVLNSKIHSGNSFDNINYVYKKENTSQVIKLNNAIIMPAGVTDEESTEFRFLKKHIKYKVSELFFSDAVIFVEGFAEETILPFFIETNSNLNKYYISIFGINGAHAFLYRNLIKALGVPALIVTDLDIKRTDDEKGKQIDNLVGKNTTNKTIINFKGDSDLSTCANYIEDENIYLAYQGKIEGYYATSLEEAIILTNFDNGILNQVLKELKPHQYKKIVGETPDFNKNKESSNEWQVKLSSDKGKFASNLLYLMVENEQKSELPKLPEYITSGIKWLEDKLKEGR